MDHQELSSSMKQQNEVVLVITGEEPAAMAAAASASSESLNGNPKVETLEDFSKESSTRPNSPKLGPNPSLSEITKSSPSPSPSPRKPPRPPQPETLIRRRSISKPKSRFVEQPPPPAAVSTVEARQSAVSPHDKVAASSPRHGSPTPRASGTPKTSRPGIEEDPEEDEEDEEIYKKQPVPASGERQRKWKVRTLSERLILVVAMGCLIASLTVHRLQGSVIWGLEIWKWCLMVTVICCGHLVTQWFVTVAVFSIERNYILKKKVLYFVYGLKNSVQVCIWLGLVLLTWSLLFSRGVRRSRSTAKALDYVSRALAALLIGSILWLVKTLLVKILASSFHMNKFFDRIQESIFHQYLLQTLSGPPLMELAEKIGNSKSSAQLSFRSIGKGKGKGGEQQEVIDVGKLHRMRQEKVSAWTMKGLIHVIRSSGLSTIANTIESYDEGGEQRDTEITSEWEAKAAAYKIFKNVSKPGFKYIDVEDLLRFLNKDELEFVLPLFEGAAETGKIKKSALRNWVVKAYLDRKSLVHSLTDTKTAIRQLHKLASVIVGIVIIIVTLLLMGVATTKLLVVLSSQLLLVGFMFGNTCKTVFEAIIFVFVMHPFDVGDRCVVDGVQMIVEEMNILTTTFLRYDNEKIYYPNAVLSTKPISNFYRSPEMGDSIEFAVDVSTPMESIGSLKSKIKVYIDSKPNHWQSNHSIVVKDIVNVNKLNMTLSVKHTMNFQNFVEKNSRRSDLVLELKKIFEQLSIRYHLLPQEVQLSYSGSTPLPISIEQSF